MADWRVARGLEKLLAQVNEIAPNRSKVSDGSIGDPAHQGTSSDHNPDDQGVVRARDFTHDPMAGANMHAIAEAIRLSRDQRVKYTIFDKRIFSSYATSLRDAWEWGPYDGDNLHTKHMHVSVVGMSIADDTSDWEVTVPLTNDDIKRVSDATAAKVLGKAWAIPGRTLVGTFEAFLNYEAARRVTEAELKLSVEDVLAAAHNDSETPVDVPEELRADLSERIATRTSERVIETLGTTTVEIAAETLLAAWGLERAAAVAARLGELTGGA